MISIRPATSSDIPVIQCIANATWWPTYSPILPREQLSFMLELIYSSEALTHAMTSGGQEFLMLADDHEPLGFAAFGLRSEDPAIAKLHKLYILPGTHGKGYGKALLKEVISIATGRNIRQLELNVNRFNTAKGFYEKEGFRVIREEDVPIGEYWMNDFVMGRTI